MMPHQVNQFNFSRELCAIVHHRSEAVIGLDTCTQLEPFLIFLHGGENQRGTLTKPGCVPLTAGRPPSLGGI